MTLCFKESSVLHHLNHNLFEKGFPEKWEALFQYIIESFIKNVTSTVHEGRSMRIKSLKVFEN